jgi:hypothetical protein
MPRLLQNGIFGFSKSANETQTVGNDKSIINSHGEEPMDQNIDKMALHRWTEELGSSTETNQTSSSSELTRIKLELIALKRQVQEMQTNNARTETRHQETIEHCKKMVEKTLLLAKGSEEKLRTSIHGLLTEMSTIKGRLRENKLAETKVEEMINRHNNVVQMFEQRMEQLQKFIKEQEMKLATYCSLLSEAQVQLKMSNTRRAPPDKY